MDEKDLRLLIVDDEEAARYGMRRALQTFGGDIAEAENAEAARALMRETKFDLLLLDVNLPGISGLEFLNELQRESQENKTQAPLVIIITAHGSERLAVQAVKSGAYDYLSKPFELDDLRADARHLPAIGHLPARVRADEKHEIGFRNRLVGTPARVAARPPG